MAIFANVSNVAHGPMGFLFCLLSSIYSQTWPNLAELTPSKPWVYFQVLLGVCFLKICKKNVLMNSGFTWG